MSILWQSIKDSFADLWDTIIIAWCDVSLFFRRRRQSKQKDNAMSANTWILKRTYKEDRTLGDL